MRKLILILFLLFISNSCSNLTEKQRMEFYDYEMLCVDQMISEPDSLWQYNNTISTNCKINTNLCYDVVSAIQQRYVLNCLEELYDR